MIAGGSFHGTRTTGVVSVWEIACSIGSRLLNPVAPCWRSTQSVSNPCRAMTSAVNVLATEIHPIVTGLFSFHSCLILLGRIGGPRWFSPILNGGAGRLVG